MGCNISTNVRCLLWRKGLSRSEWLPELMRKSGLSHTWLVRFLNGEIDDAELNRHELAMFAELVCVGDEPDNLRHAGYAFDGCNILVENLRYLLNSLGRGGKKVLAAELGVDPTTISRWLNGSFVPQTPTLRHLISRFGLPLDADLYEQPIFLSALPISIVERRGWLHKRIDDLPPDELKALYPALRRMLEER